VLAVLNKLLKTAVDWNIIERMPCVVRLLPIPKSVLKWAFEGKLVDQNSTDEPAEKLLARIRAERAAVSLTKKTPGRQATGAA
jgi:hypothetical protein